MIIKFILWLWCGLFHWRENREVVQCGSDFYNKHFHTIVECLQCGRIKLLLEPAQFTNLPSECKYLTVELFKKNKHAALDEETKRLIEEGISRL